MRRAWTTSLLVVAGAAALLLLRQMTTVLIVLAGGLTLATALRPAVVRLRRRGLGRRMAALVVFVMVAAAAGLLVGLLAPILVDQIEGLLETGPRYLSGLRANMMASSSSTMRHIAMELPLLAGGAGASPRGGASEFAALAARAAGGSVLVLASFLVGFGLVVEGQRAVRRLLLALPIDRRAEARALLVAAERKVGGYVRGQVLVSAIVGVMALAGYSTIRLPYAFLLAVVYAVMEAVPVVGPMLAAGGAALVAFSVGPGQVLWVALIAVVIQLVENYVLVPRIMKATVGVTPLVTMLAVVGFGSMAGVAGAILAIPAAAVVQLLIDRYLLNAAPPARDRELSRDRQGILRWELRQIAADARQLCRGHVAPGSQTERVEDSVEGIALDLERLLATRASAPVPPRPGDGDAR